MMNALNPRNSALYKIYSSYQVTNLQDAVGEGEFTAAMMLYTDQRYFTPHAEPPVMPLDGTLYVGVALIGEQISSDIFLLMEDCWATVTEDADALPQYPLVYNG